MGINREAYLSQCWCAMTRFAGLRNPWRFKSRGFWPMVT